MLHNKCKISRPCREEDCNDFTKNIYFFQAHFNPRAIYLNKTWYGKTWQYYTPNVKALAHLLLVKNILSIFRICDLIMQWTGTN